jgi:plasmid stabilization system protein ParE
VTTPAHHDLVKHGQYLSARNQVVARRFLQAVQKSFDRIQSAPDRGEIWREDEHGNPYRCWCVRGFEKYVIYFRVLPTSTEIARVLHSAQDAENEVR